jgi:putative transferase (TIGR04331 family)
MKRVLFGKVHEKFNLKTHIPFGPWCFIGHEDKIDFGKYQFPSDAFKSKEDFQRAEQNVDSLIDFLFPFLCHYLNSTNNVNRSWKFWQIMIMPWLSLFIQNVISNYYRLNRFIEENGKDFIFECSSTPIAAFGNTLDFILNGIRSADYNSWVYSEILKKCFLNPKIELLSKDGNSHCTYFNNKNSYKLKIKFLIKNLFAVKSIYGLKIYDSLVLSFLVKRKTLIKKKDYFDAEKIKSCFLPEMNWKAFLIKCIPECFLNIDQYSPINLIPNYRFQLVSGSLLYTEEEQKYQLATYIENGGSIIPCQHGSNYGVLSSFLWIKHVEYCYSNYISWGWNHHQGIKNNAIPLPAPLIEKFKKKNNIKKKNAEILLIGTTTSPFYDFIGSFHQPNQVIEYRQDKLTFLSLLSKTCYRRLKYRYYPVSTTQLEDKGFILKKLPDIRLCEGDLHPQMGQASLVVSDHPGTTFNLTMGSNVPTIGFWNPEHWGFTEEAKELFYKLKQQKIIFDSPKEAANHINRIADNISEWWNSTKVQEARIDWCDKYARTSDNWKKDWKQAIEKLNEEIISV